MFTSGTQTLHGRTVNHDPKPWCSSERNNDRSFRSPYRHLNDAIWYAPRLKYAVPDNSVLLGLRLWMKDEFHVSLIEVAAVWRDALVEDPTEFLDYGCTEEEIRHAVRVLNKVTGLV